MANLKGIKQVLKATYDSTESTAKTGYLWFVRENTTTEDGDVYFGSRHYGHFGKNDLTAITASINEIVGELGTGFTTAETVAMKMAELNAELNNEISARTSADTALSNALANKTDLRVTGANGVGVVFNEADGGGAKYEHTDGTWSYAGVNDGGANGLAAQIYAVDSKDGYKGSKLDVTRGGIYYTTGDESKKSVSERDVEANEIAVKGDFAGVVKSVNNVTADSEGNVNVRTFLTVPSSMDEYKTATTETYCEKFFDLVNPEGGNVYLTNEIGFSDMPFEGSAELVITVPCEGVYILEITSCNGFDENGNAGKWMSMYWASPAKMCMDWKGIMSCPKNSEGKYVPVMDSDGASKYYVDNTLSSAKSYTDNAILNKTDRLVTGTIGTAYMFNEADGGGAKFEHEDTSEAFVGVNNGGKDGMMAQIYADMPKVGGGWSGSRINVYNKGIFYQSKASTDAGTAKDDANIEIAVKGDVDFALTSAKTYTDLVVSGISPVLKNSLTAGMSVGFVDAGTTFAAGTSIENILRSIFIAPGDVETVTLNLTASGEGSSASDLIGATISVNDGTAKSYTWNGSSIRFSVAANTSYTVSFGSVTNYTTPASQSYVAVAGSARNITGNYAKQEASTKYYYTAVKDESEIDAWVVEGVLDENLTATTFTSEFISNTDNFDKSTSGASTAAFTVSAANGTGIFSIIVPEGFAIDSIYAKGSHQSVEGNFDVIQEGIQIGNVTYSAHTWIPEASLTEEIYEITFKTA